MSDAWVWLRCLGCGVPHRLLSFTGEWRQWSSTDEFIQQHLECHGDRIYDRTQSEKGYSFFEIINEKYADVRNFGFDRVNEMIRDPKKLT